MKEINLLKRYPASKRDVRSRFESKSQDIISRAKEFGREYFDGDRKYGYGGYYYDGRWVPVAQDIADYFNLRPGMRLLDVGCAKGFLVKDFMSICPGLEAYGLDISRYAIQKCEEEVIGRLHCGNAVDLPFPDNSFDIVISINTLHNLKRENCKSAIMEIERVSKGKSYIQVDSYYTEEERGLFIQWALTPEFHDYPEGWVELFKESGYTGAYWWTRV